MGGNDQHPGGRWIDGRVAGVERRARLGAQASSLIRQKLKKKLIEYAAEHELDFPAAEKAADLVAERVNEDNVATLVEALESSEG